MGTRGLLGFAYKGALKVAYQNNNAYPMGLGQEVVDFCESMEEVNRETGEGNAWDILKDNVEALELVDAEDTPAPLILAQYKGADFTINDGEWSDVLAYAVGRTGLDAVFAGELHHWIDSRDFAKQSLFCEYAYVLDLDHMTLDLFVGKQYEPQDGNPFGQEGYQETYPDGRVGETMYPVRCLASYPLNAVPENWDKPFDDYQKEKTMVERAKRQEQIKKSNSNVHRIENTRDNHNKYWQITKKAGYIMQAEWGPIGKTPRYKDYTESEAWEKYHKKLKEGYHEV